jgi:hypothetical protein
MKERERETFKKFLKQSSLISASPAKLTCSQFPFFGNLKYSMWKKQKKPVEEDAIHFLLTFYRYIR